MLNKRLHKMLNPIRRLVRRSGWDVVRYCPSAPLPKQSCWPTLLGAANLPIHTVLDIGAKDGDTARIFRHYFPAAALHCFEPHPQSFAALAAWASQQRPAVYCYPCALGDQSGVADLYVSGSRLAVASLLPPQPIRLAEPAFAAELTTLPVPVRRLDEVTAELELADELLVKIDAEGFDKQVILGGMAVLRRAAACIVEVHVWERYGVQPSLREIMDLLALADLSYAGTLRQGQQVTGAVSYIDALFIKRRLL